MSMMIRRGVAAASLEREQEAWGSDPRFPEAPNAAPAALPLPELRRRLETLTRQEVTGYLAVERKGAGGQADQAPGTVLLHDGQPIHAWCGGAQDSAALERLLASANDGAEALCTVHALSKSIVLALAATFHPPQLTQPFGTDSGEVAMLLRELSGVRHSGTVQIAADGAARATWVRILMHEGKFLGVYSMGSRQLKPSLAEIGAILTEPAPRLTLFTANSAPVPLVLPAEPPATQAEAALPGATRERDELLETDLVWFLSRFERAFSRLKERKDVQADLLRILGELTNELATFVATLIHSATAESIAPLQVVATELERARRDGAIGIDLKLGKAGLDPGALAKAYSTQPKQSYAAAEYFRAGSAAMLVLIERLLERMLGAFHDTTAAALAREGCETLLREVRGGLAEMTTTRA